MRSDSAITERARKARVAFIDLNSFSLYPTMGIGYLVAVLRRQGFEVQLVSPLAKGVVFQVRETHSTWLRRFEERLTFDNRPTIVRARRWVASLRSRAAAQRRSVVAAAAIEALQGVDVVLVSTYLEHRACCEDIGRAAAELRIPYIIGGQAFSQPTIAQDWLGCPGLTALVTGEGEQILPDLIQEACAGRVSARPGVAVPGSENVRALPPLQDLDSLPYPDYDDFPWDRYPRPLIPILASRGCAFGVCSFCSDVVTTNGRTFRARSARSVLQEMEHQSARYGTRDFIFMDLKLNGDHQLWDELIEGIPKRLPGARWTCAVHVDGHGNSALDRDHLEAARRSGNVRITTGIESGSQAVLDAMSKGTRVETTSRFLRDAAAARLSVRCTMIHGYPGEEATDVIASARFLSEHGEYLDRVRLSRFDLQTGTRAHRRVEKDGSALPGLRLRSNDPSSGRIAYDYPPSWTPPYRSATSTLLTRVQSINRRPLRAEALDFEGIF